MRGPGDRMLRLAAPFKLAVQRFSFVLLVAAALLLMMLARADTGLTQRLRLTINDAVAPVMAVLSQPLRTIHRAVDAAGNLVYLHSENARLRDDNARLLKWQAFALRQEQENAIFRSLLSAQVEDRLSFISARVIGDSGGPFVRTVLLNAGAREGVEEGRAAITGDGLVGRLVQVGQRASRILLLTDLNSRVPVAVLTTRQRAFLAGDNSDLPRLTFLAGNAQVRPGDRIVTSGDGGLFPPGLPVGVVTMVTQGGAWVQPYVALDRLEYVRILRFGRGRLTIGDRRGVSGTERDDG